MSYQIAIAVHRFPPYTGGCEFYALHLARELSLCGHRVTVYTSRHPSRGQFPFEVKELRNLNPPRSGYFFWPAVFQPPILRELAGFDLLHAVDFSMFSALAWMLAGKLHHLPLVLTSFYHPPSAMPHAWAKRVYDHTIGRRLLVAYQALIVHSQFEQEQIEAHVGPLEPHKVYAIPSGPILEGVQPDGSFRRLHHLEDQFIVLYVGRIDSHKGIDGLLSAMQGLNRRGMPANPRLVIVGPREEWYAWPDRTREVIRAMGNKVLFTGPCFGPALASAYAESDVLVMPSRYETFGFTIVESLSYGTPVISTRVGIAPEIIADGHNGFLYNYGDVESLRERLRQIARLGDTLSENASNSVRDLGWNRTVQETVRVYERVIGG